MSTFKLPDLGEGLTEAEIVEWHVGVGDHVRVDQPMVSMETAKAVVELPAPCSGTVTALHGAVGDIIATGAALIDFDSGTVVGTMPGAGGADVIFDSGARDAGQRTVGRDRLASKRGRAVPVARALAKRLGLNLDGIVGSGTDGVLTLDDVLLHANIGGAANSSLAVPAGSTAEPLRGARRAMANSMSRSRDQVAGSTVCDDADLHAWAARGDYSYRVLRATIAACTAEPALNAWYDPSANARVVLAHIDVALAVDTPGGLIVPVLRQVQNKTAEELRGALRAAKTAAHQRSVAPGDLRDFTFMLSNFGTLAGRYGVPLVVPPAVAILGVGKARQEAVVGADGVVAHRRLPLSLSFDHRCITGGEACRFLAALIADLEKTK